MRTAGRSALTREILIIAVCVLLALAGLAWLALRMAGSAPPSKLVLASASQGSPYDRFAERYAPVFARNGVKLEIRKTDGSMDNFSRLNQPGGDVSAGFLQGGLRGRSDGPDLVSMGRVLYEPLWVFSHGSKPLERLTDLIGKRVLVGPKGGGTYVLATQLLAANGVTEKNARLISLSLPDYVDVLARGEADAGFLVLGAEARTVQRLLRTPGVQLMSFANADAYSQKFPSLSKLVMREGVIDLGQRIPPADTTLISTTAAVLVRKETHPALVGLLAQAISEVHGSPSADRSDAASLFVRSGDFPTQVDPEFPMSEDARRTYRNGAPFLQRYLPFWVATMIDRLLVSLVVLVPLLIPLSRIGPQVYRWRIRRRILYWYGLLKNLEARAGLATTPADRASQVAELDSIETAVGAIPIPLGFADQYYQLRQHIEVVRNRLCGRLAPGFDAAQPEPAQSAPATSAGGVAASGGSPLPVTASRGAWT